MNVFNKVTLQSLKKNKPRTIVTIVGIILSAAMICAVTTFASSFMNYALETTIYSDGNWHGCERDTEYKTYEDILEADKIEKAVYLQQLGYAYADGCENEFKPYIYVLGAGEDVEEVFPIHITSGKYPTASTEIMLPEHLYTNGGVKYKLGDIITLGLGQRMLDGWPLTQNNPCYIYDQGSEVLNGEVLEVNETRTYTVVGFYERLSWRIEPITAPGYTALTLSDAENRTQIMYDVYFCMKNPKETLKFMSDMGLTGKYNSDLLMFSGSFPVDGFSTMLYSLAAIVIGLIMFGSVALIYNAFSISVSERTKQFGLLSSVGATKKQLKKMVLFEAFAVSIIGIPLGVIAGVGGIGVTLMFVGDKFRSMGFPIDMKLNVSTISIVIAAIVALITVLISAWIPSKRATRISAVEAIRQNTDIKNTKPVKTSKVIYKFFGLPGMLANKYYKRSKKKYRTTVLSLFMSIVLFVSASAFTEYLIETADLGLSSSGYDLRLSVSGNEFDTISPDELLSKIKATKSVTGGAYLQNRNVCAEINTENLTQNGLQYIDRNHSQDQNKSIRNFYPYITFVDDTTFRTLLKENSLDEDKYMDQKNPLGIALDGLTIFNMNTEKYETVVFLNNNNVQFDVVENENRMSFNIGFVMYENPYFINESNSIQIIYPLSLAENIMEDFHEAEGHYQFVITSDNHTEGYTDIQSILSDQGFKATNLQNIAEQEESERNIITLIRVFSYGFVVLISLIAAANVFNTITTNISLRRKEFAMLKSVGMTQKDFYKMMNFECLLYGTRALLYGLPASCGVTFLIYLAVTEGYEGPFRLPWTAIGIAVLSVFLVVFITMLYSMRKIRKDNPIDGLKNENL